jgi:hypothetical protein
MMNNEEIRRRKTTDPEMDAINVVTQALAPLDMETCRRVLKWAEDRFIEEPKRRVSDLAWAGLDAQIKGYKEYSQRLGVDDRTLAHALKHVREAKGLAPLEHDPDPEGTVQDAAEEIRRAVG